MSTTIARISDAADLIRERKDFTNRRGNFRGVGYPGGVKYGLHSGRLPGPWAGELVKRSRDVTYVVYSYSTPIAWVYKDGEIVAPAYTFSSTTVKHQAAARQGLGFVHGALSRRKPGATHVALAQPKGTRRPAEIVAKNVRENEVADAERRLSNEYSRFQWYLERAA